jgi:hypothetical protein
MMEGSKQFCGHIGTRNNVTPLPKIPVTNFRFGRVKNPNTTKFRSLTEQVTASRVFHRAFVCETRYMPRWIDYRTDLNIFLRLPRVLSSRAHRRPLQDGLLPWVDFLHYGLCGSYIYYHISNYFLCRPNLFNPSHKIQRWVLPRHTSHYACCFHSPVRP